MAIPKKDILYNITGKILTQSLHDLARDVISSSLEEDGSCTLETRAEMLAREVWNAALGITYSKNDDDVEEIKFSHKPLPWAVGIIFERLEGKIVPRARDNQHRPSLGNRIDEQQQLKVNSFVDDDS